MTKATKTTKKDAKTDQLKVGQVDLKPFFTEEEMSIGFNPNFIHQVLLTYLGNAKQITSKVKDRSEVSGGGRKPWRQKGTGRARHGSIRSPLWRSGGVTFGPSGEQNYSRKLTKKMKKKAIRFGILSFVLNNNLILLDEMEMHDSTRKMNAYLSKLPLSDQNLLVLDQKTLSTFPFVKNIKHINTTSPELLSPLQLFTNHTLICTKDTLEEVLSKVKPAERR